MSFSKQPKTEKSHGSTWSVGDFDQCVSLIVKAKQRPGAFEDVMRRVDRIQSGHHSDALASGLADGDYALCDEVSRMVPYSSPGGMSDAAKRQRELDEYSMVSGVSSDAAVYTSHVPKSPPYMVPGTHLEKSSPTLPSGVVSLLDWGEYKVPFGKYKMLKRYHEVLNEPTIEMISYRAYLFSHEASGSAQLRDLVAYLRACGLTGAKERQAPVIPGTHIERVKWSCSWVPVASFEFLDSDQCWITASIRGTFMPKGRKGRSGCTAWLLPIYIYIYIYINLI